MQYARTGVFPLRATTNPPLVLSTAMTMALLSGGPGTSKLSALLRIIP